jgi:hypothetical protein
MDLDQSTHLGSEVEFQEKRDSISEFRNTEFGLVLNYSQKSSCTIVLSLIKEKSCDPIPEERNHIESLYEAMAGYARCLMTVPSNQEQEYVVCAQVFVFIYDAQKARVVTKV